MSSQFVDVDFGRSNLYFSTNHSHHTPRLLIDAICHVTPPGKERMTFYLTCACIAERMYTPTDLIHDPVAEFNLIAQVEGEVVMIKRHADASGDVRTALRFGQAMPTHDGKGATIKRLDVSLSRFQDVSPITMDVEFQDALLNNQPINVRTSFTDKATGFDIVMEYPAKTVNTKNDTTGWQVDAGPVLAPNGNKPDDLTVEHLDLGFIVFNRDDYAEIVIRDTVALKDGGKTNHYQIRRNIDCRNELFVANLQSPV